MTATRIALSLLTTAAILPGQESRARSIDLPRHDGGRYFLIDARGEVPRNGAGLLVVLPGGDGGPDFLPFVENGILGAAPEDFVGAMVTSVRWSEEQEIVWPTERLPVDGMKFATEDYVEAVVQHVRKQRKIDPKRVFLLAWSSSGPATYEIALRRRTPFAGFYVAMSVFKPDAAALRRAKGRRFVLDQSPDDRVTPFRFATAAREQLTEHGAAVWLRTYTGGHGWHDGPIPRVRSGLRWLLSDEPPPEGDPEPPAAAAGQNLLENGGFEQGTAGWTVIDNSGTTAVEADSAALREGDQALRLTKTGRMPLDLIRQDVDLAGRKKIQVSAEVKCADAKNTFVKFFVYGDDDEVLNQDVDLVQLRGDRDWQRVARTYDLPDGAHHGVFMVVMVLDGKVWIDDVRVVAID